MLSDRKKDALGSIRLNVEAIAGFTKDMTFEQFANDRLTFYAVTRALETISEASRRLLEDLKAHYPEIRWRAIRDAGNVYRPTYSKVSKADVRATALQQLGSLQDIVARELDGSEPSGPAAPHTKDTDERSKR